MPMDIDNFDEPDKPDYQRANGAPMVMVDGKRQRMARTSGYAKPLDDDTALTNWKTDTACFGVAGDKALQARYIATKRDDRKAIKDLREDSIQAGRGSEAADVGTAIHAMSERWEQETDFDPPEPFKAMLLAYSAEMVRLGLNSDRFEFQSVTTEYNAAGTADRLYRLTRPLTTPTGEILPEDTLIIGDLKTSKTLDYSKGAFATQLSLYAQGRMYDVVADEFDETPEINQDWGVIAWIPSNQEGHCEFIWIDLQAGNEGAYLAHQIKEWRKKWRKTELTVVASPFDAKKALVTELGATDEWVADLLPFIKARIAIIRGNSDALKQLMLLWPEDCPTPKQGITEPEHASALLGVLDKVEAEFGLPFEADDPRSVPGSHKSAGPVSNTKET